MRAGRPGRRRRVLALPVADRLRFRGLASRHRWTPYDLIVLGAGSAARDAANKASREFGARARARSRGRAGAVHARTSPCKPTKALSRRSRAASATCGRSASSSASRPRRSVQTSRRIHAWKESLRKPQAKWVEELESSAATTRTRGWRRFVDPHTIRVDGHELIGERILIATGSRTAVPPIPGLDELDWIDHVTALDLEQLPATTARARRRARRARVRAGSSRASVRASRSVQGAPRVSPRSDADATAQLEAAFEEEGIDVLTGTTVERFEQRRDRRFSPTVARSTPSVCCSRSGRVPNVEELGLEAIGVRTHRAGIEVNERLRTQRRRDLGGRRRRPASCSSRRSRSTRRGSPSRTCSPPNGTVADYSNPPHRDLHRPGARRRRPDRARRARAGALTSRLRRTRSRTSRARSTSRRGTACTSSSIQPDTRRVLGVPRRQPRQRATSCKASRSRCARTHRRRPRAVPPCLPVVGRGREVSRPSQPRPDPTVSAQA